MPVIKGTPKYFIGNEPSLNFRHTSTVYFTLGMVELCIVETRVKQRNSSKILEKFFGGWSWHNNYACSEKGRIWVLCRNNVKLVQLECHAQFIHCKLLNLVGTI